MRKRLTNEEFIAKSIKTHGNKYNYSKSFYTLAKEKVIIICPLHGDFIQQPYAHYSGQGCQKCHFDKLQTIFNSNTEDFIKKSIKIHKNKYDYSLVKYITTKAKVIIICNKHGKFLQSPRDHLRGNGCTKCKYENVSEYMIGGYTDKLFNIHPEYKNNKGFLYLVKMHNDTEEFYKIGISVNVEHRLKSFREYKRDVIYKLETTLFNAFKLEQGILKKFKKYKYLPVNNFQGHTECIKCKNGSLQKIKNYIKESIICN